MADRRSRPIMPDLTGTALPPVLLLLLGIITVLPISALLIRAFLARDGGFVGLDNFIRYATEPGLAVAAWNSASLSAISTVIVMALAFPYAYALVRTRIPGRGFFRLMALLPLLAPSLLPAFGMVFLFGNQGWLKHWLLGESLYGPVGIVMASAFYAFPHAVLILSAGLSAGDQRHYEAARALKAGPWRRFVTVTLPSCRYAAISAASIVYILVFTDFGIPSVVGGSTNVLATDIYKLVIGRFDFEMGAVVGVLLLVPAVIAYGIDWFARRSQRSMITGKSVPIEPERLVWRDAALFGFAAVVTCAILAILGMAIYGSLVRFWPYNLTLGLQNYERLFTDDDEFRALGNSLVLAAGTALIGTTMVALSGWLVARRLGASGVRNGLQAVAMVPVAVPGLVLGLGYVFFFNNPANPLHGLQGTMLLIMLCTVAHFYTVPHLMAVNELQRLDREIDMAAQALRVRPAGAARRVYFPVLMPTLVDVAGYFFVNAMTTVSALIFLFTAQTRVAAIAVINLVEGSRIGQAAAFAVLIMAMSMVATAIQMVLRGLVLRSQNWRRRTT
ncbi:putative 2-aminoethylphosphonate ABC transporter permease subunit [Bosea sp. (in: a-proteobacteria)]|uniref:putative 2-aminoethylphosphonate ABC transporter permease subunit n=1 Tax=Bosea sp. (in: a-proteobacteria) TaxID=1871050 RepID=UPI003F709510